MFPIPELKDILKARKNISPWVRETPLEYHRGLSAQLGAEVYLKMEMMRETRAFKIRGACHFIAELEQEERERGVIAASGGSHALGVAYAASVMKVPAVIVVTTRAPKHIAESCRLYGAEVIVAGEVYDDACGIAMKIAEERGLTFIHSYDHPAIVAGQGTVGLEIFHQLPDPDVILCPVGGGGLINGVMITAEAFRPQTEVWGVEPEGAPAMTESLRAGKRVRLENPRSVADKLVTKEVGRLNFEMARRRIPRMVTVSEEQILHAMYLLMSRANLWVEGAAASALAAAWKEREDLRGKKVVLILTGGNVDAAVIRQVLERHA